MHEIILRQHDAAAKMSGKDFVLGVAGVLLRLAIAQMICNALISLTGMGLLNLAFYLYAVYLLVMFMRKTVAGYIYTLKDDMLVLERRLGDSTITVIEIPLENVAAMRPVRMGERMETAYRDVMVIDPAARPTRRVRAAFWLSLLSCRLARMVAGKDVEKVIGHVIVYDHGCVRRACVFRPNEEMCRALEERLSERFGFDERMTHAFVKTLHSRALERAFPTLYPYVDPLVKPEDVKWAKEELDARKAKQKERAEEKAKAKAEEKKKAEAVKKRGKIKADKNEKDNDAKAAKAEETPRRRRKQG